MDQRPLRIVHLVQTKLKIDRIPVQCDVFEARAYYFHGILQALRNNLRLQLSQCLDILIDGDQLFYSGSRVQQLPACRSNEKHYLARKIIKQPSYPPFRPRPNC